MNLFRSEVMTYYQIIMPKETAWETLNELGQLQTIQFVDQDPLTAAFARPFADKIKQIEEVENKLVQINQEMKRFNKTVLDFKDYHIYLEELNKFMIERNEQQNTYFEECSKVINEQHEMLFEQIKNYDELKEKQNFLSDYRAVLTQAKKILGQENIDQTEGENFQLKGQLLNYIIGSMETDSIHRFQKMVFRVTKGNVFQTNQQIYGDDQSDEKKTSSFIIICPDSDLIKNKIFKLCDSFNARRYSLPKSNKDFQDKIQEIDQELAQTKQVLAMTKFNVDNKLNQFTQTKISNLQCSYLTFIMLYLQKEKAIFSTMNFLKQNNTTYLGYCWIPEVKIYNFQVHIEKILLALKNLKRRQPEIQQSEIVIVDPIPEHMVPPTYFETNTFTEPFQQIVNTYGIPRYREVNPGLFAIIMFPYLFGVMFGDIAHGGALFLFGLYLVKNAHQLKQDKSALEPFLPFRFLLALMGFFATFAGFIYNDFASIPLDIFGSCYNKIEGSHHTELIENCVYPIGLDPKWYIASNELNFFNSLKMKMAVIIGVIQMSFGIMLKGSNAIYFKQPLDLIFEFIPQIIFLMVTFGYMCVMILIKWTTNWNEVGTDKAPSIIGLLINMPLAGGSTKGMPLYDMELQESLQGLFLTIALIMVPVMLLPKPLIMLLQNMNKETPKKPQEQQLLEKHETPTQGGHGHGEFEFGEVFVHQIIETIEFVLGSISNTASYLRLWALSLAHGQLAKVFFEKTIGGGIEGGSFMACFIGWPIFINVSFGVLMCMDLMECFLHALRLQWVEFQNKFFKADGYIFAPLSFQKSLEEIENRK